MSSSSGTPTLYSLPVSRRTQVQALDRTQPGLPMKKGRAQTMTHDYKRHRVGRYVAGAVRRRGKVSQRLTHRNSDTPAEERRQIQTGAHMGQGCDLTAAMFVRKLSIQHGLPIN